MRESAIREECEDDKWNEFEIPLVNDSVEATIKGDVWNKENEADKILSDVKNVERKQGCETRCGAVIIIFYCLVLSCAIDRFFCDRFARQALAPSYQERTKAPLLRSVYGPCPSNSLGVLWTPKPQPCRKRIGVSKDQPSDVGFARRALKGPASSADILAQMAASAIKDHAYGSFPALEVSETGLESSTLTEGVPSSGSHSSGSDQEQDEPKPSGKRKHKSHNVQESV
ncbi:hypothetical protein NDU88_002890 [Pleurodeles waltl]|uniref:Uncharacterized protein n=1 Tax=Pleurodeles waltl TaxID=8319 RepID=A0AAV7PC65_PLEWA|nr:hypothetical protein NDU88_002890 [Pleurodeles waltl]